jgi:hypothetical protein
VHWGFPCGPIPNFTSDDAEQKTVCSVQSQGKKPGRSWRHVVINPTLPSHPFRAYEYGDNSTRFDSRLIISAEITSDAL